MSAHYNAGAPFDTGTLQVSDLHTIAYYQYGNPKGQAAVYLHGGPGGGASPHTANFFNPKKYRVILFDQRGCGKSTPHAELRQNTTWDLAADMEKLRTYLNIESWLVCGGSWGAALALAYAQTYPKAVHSIIVRGIFTLRRQELLWFYQEGASWLFPDLWEQFQNPIPPAERGDMISAYYRRLIGNNAAAQQDCAAAWSAWEAATLSFAPSPKRMQDFADPQFALAFARIECHYFVHGGFMETDGQLIDRARQLNGIRGAIIQGRYDVVTPAKTAWDLAKNWQTAELMMIADAGHAADEPGIAAAICQCTDRFAD